MNDRWDTVLTAEPITAWRTEARACKRLAAKRSLPPALGASLRFRAYLAERDLFVRKAGQAVWRIRAELSRGNAPRARMLLAGEQRYAVQFAKSILCGRTAARDMWRRTRNTKTPGPNELAVAADASRLRAWSAWLKKCLAAPGLAKSASPVAGAWQLLVRACNFAPAAQKIVIERQQPDGSWKDLQGLFLIEFRARAAQSRAHLHSWISAPIAWSGPPAGFPVLRLAIRGFGRVAIDGVILTDGVRHLSVRPGTQARILGRPAPSSGYPDFDWGKNRGTWVFKFQPGPGTGNFNPKRVAKQAILL